MTESVPSTEPYIFLPEGQEPLRYRSYAIWDDEEWWIARWNGVQWVCEDDSGVTWAPPNIKTALLLPTGKKETL